MPDKRAEFERLQAAWAEFAKAEAEAGPRRDPEAWSEDEPDDGAQISVRGALR